MAHITIGPEFFAKAKNDYGCWQWAIVREFMQNCMDAPRTSSIEVGIEEKVIDGHDKTVLTVANNGEPMSRDVLVDKLLALGGSAKAAGSVGGFGKAKEILYFCHDSYQIETGTFAVLGRGAEYEIDEIPMLKGTRSTVVIDGAVKASLIAMFDRFADECYWQGSLTVDGTRLHCKRDVGENVRTYDWGEVFAADMESPEDDGRLLVRIDGKPMFRRSIRAAKDVIVELSQDSVIVLQSSRDSMKYQYQQELNCFIEEIAIDTSSSLRRKDPEVTVYAGDKLGLTIPDGVDARAEMAFLIEHLPKADFRRQVAIAASSSQQVKATAVRVSSLGHEFILKNSFKGATPMGYAPDEFNRYARSVALSWTRIMLLIWKLFDEQLDFSVGFIFDPDRVAEYDRDAVNGRVFYINPFETGEEGYEKRISRWSLTTRHKWEMLATAGHEYCHYAGFDYHDESFTSYYTLKVEPVLHHHSAEFAKCFKNPRSK